MTHRARLDINDELYIQGQGDALHDALKAIEKLNASVWYDGDKSWDASNFVNTTKKAINLTKEVVERDMKRDFEERLFFKWLKEA